MKYTIRIKIFCSVCLFAIALGAMFIPLPSQAGVGNFAEESSSQDEVVVSLRPGLNIHRIDAQYRTYIKDHIDGTNDYLLGLLPSGADVDRTLMQMRSNPDLLFAEPNYKFKLPEVRQVSHAFIDQISHAFIDGESPVDFYGQPSMANLNLAEAQNFSRGLGVKVAVIDTGLDFNHPLFVGRIATSVYDFVDDDSLPVDEPNGAGSGHGTFVAGLIMLTAPDATIMPLRVFNRDGIGTSFDIARAIRFAADNGAKAINMSFGLLAQDDLIKKAMDYAYLRAYMVASAGNDNLNNIQFPADTTSRTLSVTSTKGNDIKAPFANYNSQMDVASPGVLLYSAYPGGRWAWWSGTSFSTALVTGESVLLLALNPKLTPGELNRIIIDSGVNIDPLNYGYKNKLGRRIDYRTAINLLLSR